ncbi:MAG: hypothetical protein MZV65_15750 [Chromatiales bacterium]|nr:hypothetical protein [Chromatiales bacterium]
MFSMALRGWSGSGSPWRLRSSPCLANAFLNWVLIFGTLGFPALGVRGAAIATIVSRWLEAGIVLAVTYTKKHPPAGSSGN